MAAETPDVDSKNKKINMGPHGLGDPNDTFLRKVERDILIPKLIREKSKIKCAAEVMEFEKCCKDASIAMVYKCRQQNSALKDCYALWFENEEMKKSCTEEYLSDRRLFRLTGKGKKEREFEETMKNKNPM